MRPFGQEQGVFARSVATLVACLLLLQIAFSGFAVAATDGGQGATFGVTCATQKTSSDDGQPQTPAKTQHHGLCCIMHGGALDAPVVRAVFALVLDFPGVAAAPAPIVATPLLRVEPKVAPQSPRAPPALAA
ncbi:DUF2946 family protein [Methylocystis sp. WRRC1]|uniref:DUF2946 family protein n=1 Tax=Methylocystis sp. WRRC1 TaxID=1732014 RepID=UPI001D1453BF|nr:DUF2946 family protein [Methylocystis sp. WRRC1]